MRANGCRHDPSKQCAMISRPRRMERGEGSVRVRMYLKEGRVEGREEGREGRGEGRAEGRVGRVEGSMRGGGWEVVSRVW